MQSAKKSGLLHFTRTLFPVSGEPEQVLQPKDFKHHSTCYKLPFLLLGITAEARAARSRSSKAPEDLPAEGSGMLLSLPLLTWPRLVLSGNQGVSVGPQAVEGQLLSDGCFGAPL